MFFFLARVVIFSETIGRNERETKLMRFFVAILHWRFKELKKFIFYSLTVIEGDRNNEKFKSISVIMSLPRVNWSGFHSKVRKFLICDAARCTRVIC